MDGGRGGGEGVWPKALALETQETALSLLSLAPLFRKALSLDFSRREGFIIQSMSPQEVRSNKWEKNKENVA